ncbi:GspE/PulE family protein [Psychroflexus sp. ALD_RP9]|uniref:GspE/PulE family protein n=1 Tax=Psychroflexus sp. ALD_RP9 TaxID=2777186 RepID=UPI001A909628|nr:GspE/PulE family protein [Psychroflexus sp. ALD_RP9]QSS96293.1 type II/IV secretion system protein [Psychroflexus sp. ALD_RP9]
MAQLQIQTHLKQLVSDEQAYLYRIIPVAYDQDSISFLTDKVTTDKTRELQILFDKTVFLEEESASKIDELLSFNFRKKQQSSQFNYSEDFILNLLYNAKSVSGSDIHLEPYEDNARIRFRIDGKLIEQHIVRLEDYPVLVNKIKIKANLDISEKRLPQDGRISINAKGEEFDIRVSSLPTLYGEKIVMRILNKDANALDIQDLGMTKKELREYQEQVQKPNGIILISGPTGSGKTTTLYATLKQLNTNETNILTIEDPIEYTLKGINQVQLKESIGLDFPNTLKTFLRQDPDIIMIGEIRDAKTANMAVRAALTGHLVLSTIHTNSAWATINRLIDMGIPSYLLASTLNMSLAQRLLRTLCPHCKTKNPADPNDFPEHYKIPKDLQTYYKPVGCPECYYTGYSGRKAIYEIIPIIKTLKEKIKNNDLEIEDHCIEHNITNLRQNALQLLKEGQTSAKEVYPFLLD